MCLLYQWFVVLSSVNIYIYCQDPSFQISMLLRMCSGNPGSLGHPIGCKPCNKYKPERLICFAFDLHTNSN